MYPGRWGIKTPEHPAVVLDATGESITHGELNDRSNAVAHLLRTSGLSQGDTVAVLMENNIEYFEVLWAALRSGLYLTAINWHLTADEAAYIVNDCEAKVLVTSHSLRSVAEAVTAPTLQRRLLVGGTPGGSWDDYAQARDSQPTTPVSDESAGITMLYSSGTTGRPKGVLAPLPPVAPWLMSEGQLAVAHPNRWKFDTETIYLSPAPLYHAAPLAACQRVHQQGGTVVVMDRFLPESALRAIERHRVTHSQWVPTMFVRMLKLPAETRTAFDLSSHQVAIHAAAPCPVEVKHQMMQWWGPILWEYYAGTEAIGITTIGPDEWLQHPGSVGRADPDQVFVLDPAGQIVPPGETGLVHFRPSREFEYKGDAAKTADATSPQGFVTYGDIGYVDDGYLFLTDRKSFMIISGGVNIYPREAEDVLVGHPAVADVGVFGVPNADLGEEAKAAVQLQPEHRPTPELAEELLAYCRSRLSTYKCPRSIEFTEDLPRMPTGKIRKAELRRRYSEPDGRAT